MDYLKKTEEHTYNKIFIKINLKNQKLNKVTFPLDVSKFVPKTQTMLHLKMFYYKCFALY